MKARPIRIEGDVAYIPLTQGYEAIIDAADVPLVQGWNWSADVRKYTVYAYRSARRGEDSERKIVRLHREIMGQPELDVDHIDMVGLNNRRSNLRLATHAQNLCNRVATEMNTSGYKGVSWHKSTSRWRAVIKIHGKQKHIGVFSSKEQAHVAYMDACKIVHGEFGRAL